MWSRLKTACKRRVQHVRRRRWAFRGDAYLRGQSTRLGQPACRSPENLGATRRGKLTVRKKWLITWQQGWTKKGWRSVGAQGEDVERLFLNDVERLRLCDAGKTWDGRASRGRGRKIQRDLLTLTKTSPSCFDEDKLAHAPRHRPRA